MRLLGLPCRSPVRKTLLALVSLALLAGGGHSPAIAQWDDGPIVPEMDGGVAPDAGSDQGDVRLTDRSTARLDELLQERARMPRWLRWGLVGGAVGGVAFMALGRLTIDGEPNPPLQDAATGAVTGFTITAATIGFWDLVCAPGTSSRRAGLCGR